MSEGLRARLQVRRGSFELEGALEAEPGQTLVVAGPNGAGKSTLVAALAGLIPIDRGEVWLSDRLLERAPGGPRLAPQAREIGVVFQELWLFPRLSALDNAAFGLRARGRSRREARARARSLLSDLELQGVLTQRPQALSGGEAQRVALARALAIEPRLLLLDEPLSALDVERRPRVRALLQGALRRFAGVRLVITHDPLEALLLADRLAVIEGGRFVQVGPPDALRARPATRFVASLVGQNLIEGEVRSDAGATWLEVEGGRLIVASSEVAPGAMALARIAPSAIVLARERPKSSARNLLRGPITSLDVSGDRARLHLDTNPPLWCEVTREAVSVLGLEKGQQVWATIKATEIDVYPRDPIS
ncbi:MAG: ABC transporter ATP-binding protein [Myxococcota bacterium]